MTHRCMRWFDIAPVAAVDARAFGPEAWTEEFYWSQLATPGAEFLVDCADNAEPSPKADSGGGGIAGFAGLFVSGPQADILTIGVEPALQGRGLGGALLDALLARAGELGCSAVHLEVRADNAAALALYAARGFEPVGTRPGYYRGADAVLMRALLPARSRGAEAR